MRARQFDLIAFDWDGTLFDSTVAITRSIQLAVADVGGAVPSDERASYVIGMALMPALAYAAPDVPQEKYTELANRYRYHYFKLQEQVTLFQGVLPMLDALRERGHLLAVATGKSRRGLNEALQQADLRGVFDSSRTADETAGKPNPLMMRTGLRMLHCHSAEAVMVGDRMDTDVISGMESGMSTVLVLSGVSTRETIKTYAYRPSMVLNGVGDIVSLARGEKTED